MFSDDVLTKAKEIRKKIYDKSTTFDALSVPQKNALLEYYRTAQRHVGIDLDVVKRRIAANQNSDAKAALTAKETLLQSRLKAIDGEVDAFVRVSGISVFATIEEIVPPPPPSCKTNSTEADEVMLIDSNAGSNSGRRRLENDYNWRIHSNPKKEKLCQN